MVSEFESYPAGTTPPAVSEVIEKLVRRSKVLELVVDGGATKRSLTSEISASRTTIYRSLDQFQEEGLVEENGTEYQATVLGELLYEEYAEFTATVEAVLGAKCALTKGVEVEVPTDVFLQASVTTVGSRPVRYVRGIPASHRKRVDDTRSLYGGRPAIGCGRRPNSGHGVRHLFR